MGEKGEDYEEKKSMVQSANDSPGSLYADDRSEYLAVCGSGQRRGTAADGRRRNNAAEQWRKQRGDPGGR